MFVELRSSFGESSSRSSSRSPSSFVSSLVNGALSIGGNIGGVEEEEVGEGCDGRPIVCGSRGGLSSGDVLGHKCSRRYEKVLCNEMYVCSSGKCSKCVDDDECHRISSQFVCGGSGKCHHKALFGPFNWMDVLMFSVLIVGSTLSAAGGLGGGGLYVPILMLIGGFSTFEAIPLSKVCSIHLIPSGYSCGSLCLISLSCCVCCSKKKLKNDS